MLLQYFSISVIGAALTVSRLLDYEQFRARTPCYIAGLPIVIIPTEGSVRPNSAWTHV
jgi:hypothetical protein